MARLSEARPRVSPLRATGAQGRGLSRSVRLTPTTVHVATLVAAYVALVYEMRTQWFYYDEWNFFSQFGPHGGFNPLRPNAEHLVVGSILIFRLLFAAFGLHSYVPYIAVLLAFHVIAAHLLWRLMLRSRVDPWLATAAAVVFLMLGAGYDDLTFAFGIVQSGALAAGLAMMLLVDHRGRGGWRDGLASMAGLASLTFSGVGLVMVAGAALIAVARRGLMRTLSIIALPAVLYAIWYLAYGRHGAGVGTTHFRDLLLIPDFIWAGLTRSMDGVTGLVGAGAVLLLGLGAWLVVRLRHRGGGPVAENDSVVPAVMALTAIVMYALIGLARITLGVQEATQSRYTYVAAGLLLPAIAAALAALAGRDALRRAAAFALLLFATVHGAGTLVQAAHNYVSVKHGTELRILAAAQLAASGQPVFGTLADPTYAPQLSFATIRWMEAEGEFPTGVAVPPATILAVAAQLQLAVTPEPRVTGRPAPQAQLIIGTVAEQAGCLEFTSVPGSATALLTTTGPASVQVESDSGGEMTAVLQSPDGGVTAPPRTFTLGARVAGNIDLGTDGSLLTLELPAGHSRLCGVTLLS